jgi:hypothetical protein
MASFTLQCNTMAVTNSCGHFALTQGLYVWAEMHRINGGVNLTLRYSESRTGPIGKSR